MPDYADLVATTLYIKIGDKKIDVSEKVRRLFSDKLYFYIRKVFDEIGKLPLSVTFQNKEKPYKRRHHRRDVIYVEKTLDDVIQELPPLSRGEYVFQTFECIIEKDGRGNLFFR